MTIETHPAYNCWRHMRQRCLNPDNHAYAYYGGRGITICDRWNSFNAFAEDMGDRPINTSIERRDTNGNYEPTNCYWGTPQQQSLNRRFFSAKPRGKIPYIYPRTQGYYCLQITICKKQRYNKVSKSLDELILLRDICIYERDFLKSRGLSY